MRQSSPKMKLTLPEATENLRRAFVAPFLPIFDWLLADKRRLWALGIIEALMIGAFIGWEALT